LPPPPPQLPPPSPQLPPPQATCDAGASRGFAESRSSHWNSRSKSSARDYCGGVSGTGIEQRGLDVARVLSRSSDTVSTEHEALPTRLNDAAPLPLPMLAPPLNANERVLHVPRLQLDEPSECPAPMDDWRPDARSVVTGGRSGGRGLPSEPDSPSRADAFVFARFQHELFKAASGFVKPDAARSGSPTGRSEGGRSDARSNVSEAAEGPLSPRSVTSNRSSATNTTATDCRGALASLRMLAQSLPPLTDQPVGAFDGGVAPMGMATQFETKVVASTLGQPCDEDLEGPPPPRRPPTTYRRSSSISQLPSPENISPPTQRMAAPANAIEPDRPPRAFVGGSAAAPLTAQAPRPFLARPPCATSLPPPAAAPAPLSTDWEAISMPTALPPPPPPQERPVALLTLRARPPPPPLPTHAAALGQAISLATPRRSSAEHAPGDSIMPTEAPRTAEAAGHARLESADSFERCRRKCQGGVSAVALPAISGQWEGPSQEMPHHKRSHSCSDTARQIPEDARSGQSGHARLESVESFERGRRQDKQLRPAAAAPAHNTGTPGCDSNVATACSTAVERARAGALLRPASVPSGLSLRSMPQHVRDDPALRSMPLPPLPAGMPPHLQHAFESQAHNINAVVSVKSVVACLDSDNNFPQVSCRL